MRALRGGAIALILCLSSHAVAQGRDAAEIPRGLWQTEPDGLGVVLHVRTRRCGRDLCALVERAKNRRGYDARSDAVGAKVLWNLRAQPDGSFLGEYSARDGERYGQTRVRAVGGALHLQACTAATCRNLVWTRIR